MPKNNALLKMKSLGTLLKEARAKRAITQTQATKKIGIEQSYLSKLESDQAWASLQVLTRICKVYGIDVKTLLGQVDNDSLRGNLQYQGFLQREAEQKRRFHFAALSIAGIICAAVFVAFIAIEQSSAPAVNKIHTPVTLQLEDIEGKAAINLIADYGGLTIHGIDQVQGNIAFLRCDNEPWDVSLAKVANTLGFRVEITGAEVELKPITKLVGANDS